jgi:hypothetical protein
LAGAAVLAVPVLEEEVSVLAALGVSVAVPLLFLEELYKSEYQPPPLSTKEERLTILTKGPED